MNACVGLALLLGACSFRPVSSNIDATLPIDEAPPRDDGTPSRVKNGLIGLWTFNDAPGTQFVADTSGSGTPVPLEVITSATIAAPMFIGGSLVVDTPARLYSAENTHLTTDCIAAGGVTLEAWVKPKLETVVDPSFVAGLSANIGSRDVALLQVGNKWVGRVRTTAAADGTPDLSSTTLANTTEMTHLVVVADATQRTLYVNGVAQGVGIPGPLLGWDSTFPMVLVDEYQHARMWTGSLALVALYKRALSSDEVMTNFKNGPLAP